MVNDLPVRTKKKSNVLRHFHFVVLHWKGKILMHQRVTKDIWQGLYTPPIMERNSTRAPSVTLLAPFVKEFIGHSDIAFVSSAPPIQQLLSHQTIIGRFHHINLLSAPEPNDATYLWVTRKTIHDVARPKMIVDMTDLLH
jgi:A/G-specific adenine glycosylase